MHDKICIMFTPHVNPRLQYHPEDRRPEADIDWGLTWHSKPLGHFHCEITSYADGVGIGQITAILKSHDKKWRLCASAVAWSPGSLTKGSRARWNTNILVLWLVNTRTELWRMHKRFSVILPWINCSPPDPSDAEHSRAREPGLRSRS